jgi:hypothetical protein
MTIKLLYFCQVANIEQVNERCKVKEIEDLNSSLRKRDKVKDDAIAQLSDQLLAISTRLQEVERKQLLV